MERVWPVFCFSPISYNRDLFWCIPARLGPMWHQCVLPDKLPSLESWHTLVFSTVLNHSNLEAGIYHFLQAPCIYLLLLLLLLQKY